ncbi:M14 family metallopeptidase [Pseudoalteromonas ulvae]|uniref:Peptidase n=1 Tax=Pseudoalteromonas ulvae TaxID=107327 RepID=A0A244CLT3_PSEDV|nr:M14 family metallocarboxypeptidase [Pseudoalteromonas ulvae]OUL56570.1 peptidase [Pseudoalteromonas ulvae]
MTQVSTIGTAGVKWGETEKQQWLALQAVKRSYFDDVVSQIDALRSEFTVEQYGELAYPELAPATTHYPLFVIKPTVWQADKPTVLVTGGVHGYETSGVHGALAFAKTAAAQYADAFNIVIAPCVSPWGYETINRWNPTATDPNRSFYTNSPAQESVALMKMVKELGVDLVAHFDLHETTDSDNTEFRPALAARDAQTHDNWNIPDGFYLVGDSENPQAEFQAAIIAGVANVTHIAPADDKGEIIGAPLEQFGVINYAKTKLGLCGGLSNATYKTTTEVYPDSATATPQECIAAQVAVITSGLGFILQQ